MHRCLNISEIVDMICALLDPRISSVPGPAPYRHLASIARTCTTLQDPALDHLWSSTTLSILIRCMPSDLWAVRAIVGRSGQEQAMIVATASSARFGLEQGPFIRVARQSSLVQPWLDFARHLPRLERGPSGRAISQPPESRVGWLQRAFPIHPLFPLSHPHKNYSLFRLRFIPSIDSCGKMSQID
ncbi:hypothetical protein B0H12DRAFT_616841 [Mycena haematopus]|nr:hypothetical protein B0H12DRAFT_616841 [Mycena haematopus]